MNSDPVAVPAFTVVVGTLEFSSKEKKKSYAETNAGVLAITNAAASKVFLSMATF
jgi:hypothetical protein